MQTCSFKGQGQSFSQSLCQSSASSHRSKYDEFSNLSNIRSIAEFRDFPKDTYCTTVGKTVNLNPYQFGWYYGSCTKCIKSSKSSGASYTCSCGEDVVVPLTRYKVVIQMVYDGHKAEFLFWDSECFQILGIIAEALRKSMQEVGEDDPKIYPSYLDKLLGLEFALRVKYQTYYRQTSVVGFSCDAAIIRKIKLHLHPEEIEPEVENVVEINAPDESSAGIRIHTNIVCNNPSQSVKLEKMSSSARSLKSVPISMNIVCDNPNKSVKLEKIASSAECLKSNPIHVVGSCSAAKCVSTEKM